jgi:hypothetical protein
LIRRYAGGEYLRPPKAEQVNHVVYRSRQGAMTDNFFYVEGF